MNRFTELEAFVCIVDKGSFTAAAKQLALTTSYTSKLLSRLEDRLGVRLLHRSTRQLTLTDPGRAFYERCKDAFQHLEDAEKSAAELQSTPKGRLRISVPATLGMNFLTQPLAQFGARYPELVLDIFFIDRRVDLLSEGFDVVLRAGDLQDTSLAARRLGSADMVLCAADSYIARRALPKEPEELSQHACLIYAHHAAPTVWKLKGPEREVSVDVSGPLIANNAAMLCEAACQGLGILYVPVFHSGCHLKEGRLRRILPQWRRPSPVPIHALFPMTRHVPLKVRLFIDAMVDFFRNPPWAGWEGGAKD